MGKKLIEYEFIIDRKQIIFVEKLFSEYAESLNTDLSFQNFEEEFNSLPGKYGPPDGTLIIVRVDGSLAGCIALRKLSESICEMKRLYVRSEFRGLGIGRKLVESVIKIARENNYLLMRLDTLPTMKSAQALYEEIGFYDIEPYVYNPIEGTRFMEMKL